ncbi:MAG: diphthamide synthesis protein [Candidatus Woesearchaeota archaeon]
MVSNYELELEKAVSLVKKNNAKTVVIQLPDGLKPLSQEIQDYLEQNTKADIMIWMGSCFGACDVPIELKHMNIDLLIQWGHSEYMI